MTKTRLFDPIQIAAGSEDRKPGGTFEGVSRLSDLNLEEVDACPRQAHGWG